MWIYGFAVMAVVCMTCKETYSLELEEFLSSLSSKKDDFSGEESQEASPVNQEELLQFAKRSGIMAQPQQPATSNDALNNQKLLQMLQQLQTMNNRQQNLVVYSPEYAQPPAQTTTPQRSPRATESTQTSAINSNPNLVYSYIKPTSVSSSSLVQDQQNSIQSNPQQQTQQHRYAPQYMDAPTLAAVQKHTSQSSTAKKSPNDVNLAYSKSPNDANANLAYSNQRETNDKSQEKEDRQGQYPYEAYSGHDSGYGHARNPVYAHEPHYAHHEPVHHKPLLSLPIPQLSIKFDPLGLLKKLLSGLPRPLFNLNGKIFLGIELGKNAGLTVGAPHHGGGHYGGGKNLITIG